MEFAATTVAPVQATQPVVADLTPRNPIGGRLCPPEETGSNNSLLVFGLNPQEKAMKISGKLVALLAAVLVVLIVGPAPAAQASSAQIHVFPPRSHPYGHSYIEWIIRGAVYVHLLGSLHMLEQ